MIWWLWVNHLCGPSWSPGALPTDQACRHELTNVLELSWEVEPVHSPHVFYDSSILSVQ